MTVGSDLENTLHSAWVSFIDFQKESKKSDGTYMLNAKPLLLNKQRTNNPIQFNYFLKTLFGK